MKNCCSKGQQFLFKTIINWFFSLKTDQTVAELKNQLYVCDVIVVYHSKLISTSHEKIINQVQDDDKKND